MWKLIQVEIVFLTYHQILETNLQRNKWKLEGRINHEILGVNGFMLQTK